MRWHFAHNGWPTHRPEGAKEDVPVPIQPEEQSKLIDALQDQKTVLYKKLVSEVAEARPGVLELMDEGLGRPDIAMGICSAATKAGFEQVRGGAAGAGRGRGRALLVCCISCAHGDGCRLLGLRATWPMCFLAVVLLVLLLPVVFADWPSVCTSAPSFASFDSPFDLLQVVNSVVQEDRLGRFDVVKAGDDVDKKKPDPMIYNMAQQLVNVPPEKCVVIEDSLVGLRAAKAAGMKCIITPTASTAAAVFRAAQNRALGPASICPLSHHKPVGARGSICSACDRFRSS